MKEKKEELEELKNFLPNYERDIKRHIVGLERGQEKLFQEVREGKQLDCCFERIHQVHNEELEYFIRLRDEDIPRLKDYIKKKERELSMFNI